MPPGQIDHFRQKLIDYSKCMSTLELDPIEAALLNVLVIVASGKLDECLARNGRQLTWKENPTKEWKSQKCIFIPFCISWFYEEVIESYTLSAIYWSNFHSTAFAAAPDVINPADRGHGYRGWLWLAKIRSRDVPENWLSCIEHACVTVTYVTFCQSWPSYVWSFDPHSVDYNTATLMWYRNHLLVSFLNILKNI